MRDKIIEILRNHFSNVYCDTCANDNEDVCDYCTRKSMLWSCSKENAEKVADEILKNVWIPANEKMSTKNTVCLVTVMYGKDIYVNKEAVYMGGEFWNMNDIKITDAVIAWMPMPKPWKGENKE